MGNLTITIHGRLAGANEYILKNRTNRVAAAGFKHREERKVKDAVIATLHHKPKPYANPVFIKYRWYEANRKRDKDNIAFAHKFINDAFVEIGLLGGDGWNFVDGFSDTFFVDKANPRIEVEIVEIKKHED